MLSERALQNQIASFLITFSSCIWNVYLSVQLAKQRTTKQEKYVFRAILGYVKLLSSFLRKNQSPLS